VGTAQARDDAKLGIRPSLDRRGLRVFVSFAHHDVDMAERMRVHLKALVRSGHAAEIWFNGDKSAAETWSVGISQAIARSDVFVLLLSPDYIASDYIMDCELPNIRHRAQEANALTVPLILRPCLWQFVAGEHQAVPTINRRLIPVIEWKPVDSGYNAASEQILSAIEMHFPSARGRGDIDPGRRRLTDEQIDHAVRAVVGRHPARA
jgi:hypothetical protein